MFAYTIRRVITGILLLVVMSVVTFYLFYASSTTPERYACGPKCTAAQLETTKKSLGYDEPTYVQWGKFAKGVAVGRTFPDDPELRKAAPQLVQECPAPCLGFSTGYSAPVRSLIQDKLPVSFSLAIAAFVLWMVGGVALGITAALFKGRLLDRAIVGLSLVAFAFPTFFIGLLLLKFVSIRWGLIKLPAYTPLTENPWLWATGMILPAITLAVVYMAGYIRITRAFVLETMSEDYIRTARAKGLNQRTVIGKHTLRAVLTPLVTLSGLDLAGLLGGAIITEQVFNFNGVGKLSVTAIQRFDLPLIVGIVLLVATIVIVANIIVDLLYAVIDPRVRLG
ncbi:ABC transporter permease subunit [Nocardioides flavescens]|uniref:ABC transporter permease subunit n=1 Tax=Nocardioides flavescens TaxID=2691959 RepID=A0A6L7F104_9ACTN|nr:ABC transporter permease subunit [Nocardioides flavescens]